MISLYIYLSSQSSPSSFYPLAIYIIHPNESDFVSTAIEHSSLPRLARVTFPGSSSLRLAHLISTNSPTQSPFTSATFEDNQEKQEIVPLSQTTAQKFDSAHLLT